MGDERFLTTFWRGYRSAFQLFPAVRPAHSSRFMFRGRDLSSVTAAQALKQDWRNVGSAISSARHEIGEQEDEQHRTIGHYTR